MSELASIVVFGGTAAQRVQPAEPDLIARNDDARSTPRERKDRPPSLDLTMLEQAGADRHF
ncbi:hypothetical protein ACQEPV_012850 [Xanthomonas oryzae pv. oryzicola]|uniref:hypothetical protein n=1 Tax=Xanthomonas oryzae TaxID=347 RepID=UPI003D17763B